MQTVLPSRSPEIWFSIYKTYSPTPKSIRRNVGFRWSGGVSHYSVDGDGHEGHDDDHGDGGDDDNDSCRSLVFMGRYGGAGLRW